MATIYTVKALCGVHCVYSHVYSIIERLNIMNVLGSHSFYFLPPRTVMLNAFENPLKGMPVKCAYASGYNAAVV